MFALQVMTMTSATYVSIHRRFSTLHRHPPDNYTLKFFFASTCEDLLTSIQGDLNIDYSAGERSIKSILILQRKYSASNKKNVILH